MTPLETKIRELENLADRAERRGISQAGLYLIDDADKHHAGVAANCFAIASYLRARAALLSDRGEG